MFVELWVRGLRRGMNGTERPVAVNPARAVYNIKQPLTRITVALTLS